MVYHILEKGIDMNTSQIKCFLAATECLNFTKAAERLYMSQSGLSRQMSAFERELGIQLFERGRNSIKLTEAGAICASYLKRMMADYEKMLDEAMEAQRGKQNSLIIGGLEGQLIGECYKNSLSYLWENHPDIRINMRYFNVAELCKALMEGDVDIGIMPEAEAERLPGVFYKRSHVEECCLIIPRNHPKADKENPKLQDFRDETFLVISEDDSTAISGQHRHICRSAGFAPQKQRIVPTYGTLVMLLEMGAGISVLNMWHSLRRAPHLKFLKMQDVGFQIEAVAWLKENKNPNIPLFLNKIPV